MEPETPVARKVRLIRIAAAIAAVACLCVFVAVLQRWVAGGALLDKAVFNLGFVSGLAVIFGLGWVALEWKG